MKKALRRERAPEKSPTLEKNIGFLLRKAYQRNMVIFQEHSPHPDLTAVQAATLIALGDHNPCSLAELGRMAAMDPATTRGVVERLRKRELISTQPSLEDKREVIIHLENEGRRLAKALGPAGAKITADTMAGFSSAEQVALEFLLKKICEADDS